MGSKTQSWIIYYKTIACKLSTWLVDVYKVHSKINQAFKSSRTLRNLTLIQPRCLTAFSFVGIIPRYIRIIPRTAIDRICTMSLRATVACVDRSHARHVCMSVFNLTYTALCVSRLLISYNYQIKVKITSRWHLRVYSTTKNIYFKENCLRK